MDENVGFFMMVTGVESEEVARGYLEISGHDSGRAIQAYYDNPELRFSFTGTTSAPAAASDSAGDSSRSRNRNFTGREDASGVIHIDSDDEDVPMVNDSDEDDVAAIARTAQEEEDAAMARRLQEEFYGSSSGMGAGHDDVRAPIAQTTEMLAAPDPAWEAMDDDFHFPGPARRAPRRGRNAPNPFDQPPSIWDDTTATPFRAGSAPTQDPTRRTALLRDLFRPPHELMSTATWDEARDEGKEEKKWIMVNLQDLDIFQCQVLNRDLWKDESVRAIIKEHFIFLQYDKNETRAQSYIQFYLPNGSHDNSANYPHVSIIDPRTGEQVKVWSGVGFPKAEVFLSEVVEFLDRYSLAANRKNPVVKSKPKRQQVDVGRMTEEQMLELAMQNSLENNGASSEASVQDPDMLTKEEADDSNEKGKGRAANEAADQDASTAQAPEESAEDSAMVAFYVISSTTPHVEPENNPATTTRIQFRHSAGRIIRRFSVADPVRRIYEWLKAEPLEGQPGLFELKVMPEGADLIDKLDMSIAEAGLKQGTVMIEFIED